MSNAAINPANIPTADPSHDVHAGHNHDPHLAHHFDTPEQQYISAKLGMWIFLGTEILMFGGLFCAYAVYRHNHPDVFAFAHQYLNKWLGAVNTLVLITSSLTMAWAVRSSQLGDSRTLRWLLIVTILGGYVFLGIKSVEYNMKWKEAIFIGPNNQFRHGYTGPSEIKDDVKAEHEKIIAEEHAYAGTASAKGTHPGENAPGATPKVVGAVDSVSLAPADPNAGTSDAAMIHPTFFASQGVSQAAIAEHKKIEESREHDFSSIIGAEQHPIYTFFAVYFVMTGLHGLHVIIGMSLITWVLLRALGPKHAAWAIPMIPASIGVFLAVVGLIIAGKVGGELIVAGLILAVLCVVWAMIWVPLRRNRSGESEFGPTYFTPVDLVGLYWHLVDLIWIFLFPLLYLIH